MTLLKSLLVTTMEEAVLAVGLEEEAITEVVVPTDINHIRRVTILGGAMIVEDPTVGLQVNRLLIELIEKQDSRLSVDYAIRFTTGQISVLEMINNNNSKRNQDSRLVTLARQLKLPLVK